MTNSASRKDTTSRLSDPWYLVYKVIRGWVPVQQDNSGGQNSIQYGLERLELAEAMTSEDMVPW